MTARKKSSGFTMMEIMIAMVILSLVIMAAIAAYREQIVRAKVSEIMGISKVQKSVVSEYYSTQGSMPTNASEAGLNTNPVQSQYLQSIGVTVAGNVLTLSYVARSSLADDMPANPTIEVIGTASALGIRWTCNTGTMPLKYRPASCR